MKIHPTASIDPSATLGTEVEIGPYVVIGEEAVIGDGTRLRPHAVIEPYVTLGSGCDVFSGAVLGGIPQDRKFKAEKSFHMLANNVVVADHKKAFLALNLRSCGMPPSTAPENTSQPEPSVT